MKSLCYECLILMSVSEFPIKYVDKYCNPNGITSWLGASVL